MKPILSLLAAAALAACQTQTANTPAQGNLGNDMLPSAQVTAFQEVDQRLGYENAEIGFDENECAVYSATGPAGAPYTEVLRGPSGEPICPPRP